MACNPSFSHFVSFSSSRVILPISVEEVSVRLCTFVPVCLFLCVFGRVYMCVCVRYVLECDCVLRYMCVNVCVCMDVCVCESVFICIHECVQRSACTCLCARADISVHA